MLLYYDYIRLILCLVIVSCSPCPCNNQVHSQNKAIALKYFESLTFTKYFFNIVVLFMFQSNWRASWGENLTIINVLSVIYVLIFVIGLFFQNASTNIYNRNAKKNDTLQKKLLKFWQLILILMVMKVFIRRRPVIYWPRWKSANSIKLWLWWYWSQLDQQWVKVWGWRWNER